MDEFSNFEKILAERVERKNEEIMVQLRADQKARQRLEQEKQERERLFELEKKKFRELNLERVISHCIDYAVSKRIKDMTALDFYMYFSTYFSAYFCADFNRFFTQQDVVKILDGLVQNGLLKRNAYDRAKYSYVPRTLPDTE